MSGRNELHAVLVQEVAGGRTLRCGYPPIVVKGVPTAGVNAGQPIELKGEFQVTGDEIVSGSSLWVVEPVKK